MCSFLTVQGFISQLCMERHYLTLQIAFYLVNFVHKLTVGQLKNNSGLKLFCETSLNQFPMDVPEVKGQALMHISPHSHAAQLPECAVVATHSQLLLQLQSSFRKR